MMTREEAFIALETIGTIIYSLSNEGTFKKDHTVVVTFAKPGVGIDKLKGSMWSPTGNLMLTEHRWSKKWFLERLMDGRYTVMNPHPNEDMFIL